MKMFIICGLICMTGCRSTKTTTKAREEMKRNAELNTVAVKAGVKETNALTYWPDGSVYRFEQVKEQMDQTKLGRLDVEEKQVAAQSIVEKKTGPLKIWVCIGMAVALIVSIWGYLKFKN